MAGWPTRSCRAAPVDEAVAALDADPAAWIHGKEAFRDWMQELADRAVAELAGMHFDIPEQIRRIECCLAPTSDGGIYYTGPERGLHPAGPDVVGGARRASTTFSTWREVTTVYHEGVPGHHLQVGQTAVPRPSCSTAGSGCCAGSPATARAGRSTPSG